jgi:UDP-N-acetylglucosamine 1-carboxyvinyltransferase
VIRALRVSGGRPLRGAVTVSGSKNAALPILAASLLTRQPCRLTNVPELADVDTTLAILETLGAGVARVPADATTGEAARLEVRAEGTIASEVPSDLAVRMRASILFMGPLLARTGRAVVPRPGGDAIGMRRFDQHVSGLTALGAVIEEREGDLVCHADGLTGADVQLDMPTVTGTENLMMAACLARGRTTILNAAREPHIQDLAGALRAMGAAIEGDGTDEIVIEGVERLHGCQHRIRPDYLEAGTFAIAVAATGGEVALEDAPMADLGALVIKLRRAGVEVGVEDGRMVVRRERELRPVDLITWTHPGFATDLQPQYTALMTQARGDSVVQEFLFENRFEYVDELRALGADIWPLSQHRRGDAGAAGVLVMESRQSPGFGRGVRIHGPARLRGARLSIPDIRAGAAIVIAALCAEGESEIAGLDRLDRGYERLAGKLAGLGADLSEITPGSQ